MTYQASFMNISETMIAMATGRGENKTICPSEVACALFPHDWRKHMDMVKSVAIDLHREGKVMIMQKGNPVNIKQIKGPIRIKRI